jgi:hypothetical protein
MCSITLHINRKNLLGSLIWCLWFSKKEAVYLDRTQSNSLPFIRRKEPLPLFRRRVMAYSFTKRLQFASLSFSLARPCLENSKKKEEKLRIIFQVSFLSVLFFFNTSRSLVWGIRKEYCYFPWCCSQLFLIPRLCLPPNQREFAQTFFSRRRTQVYLCLLSILVTYCGLATGCTTYPSGRTRRSEDFLVLSFPVQCLQ